MYRKASFYVALIFTLCLVQLNASAQTDENRQKVDILLKEAKTQMEAGDYAAANLTFRKMLALKAILPDDVSYLFAETLFYIGQYQNSQNLLKRYMELTGIQGNYYQQSKELEALLQEKLVSNKTCDLCNAFGYRLAPCTECEGSGSEISPCNFCRGKGVNHCLSCDGEGVTIKYSALGEKTYNTCTKCEGKGFHACTLCKGAKEIETYCSTCFGDGMKSTTIVCNHLPHNNHE
ncbi:hypothetical protein QWY31_01280 [Cytophagales bacterium LB-30]|uniref:Molecular chaperone DnaJ n=1 Tax=Shiella aurantiaca TaxID=3058365 RepID=A0ABT8F131_9BACT|nr:hypothetical protein [Shiella aurantiaca]MDN4164108.1 hypothetical protein [Shiella aurantiaca]